MTDKHPAPRRIALFGATSGIAVALARRYAEGGARIVLIGRDAAALAASARDLEVRGAAKVAVIEADFAALDDLPGVAHDAWSAFDGLDAAVVAYGSLPDQAAAQSLPRTTADALLLNFVSPATLIGALAPLFEAERAGTIAAITSVAGDRGRKSNYVYGAAKGGLQRFLEGLRHRLHGVGVGVLDVRPGFVATKMTAHLARTGPLWATPDQVAADIEKAIEKRRAVLYTPWFWRLILLVVCALPRPLFHRSSL